MLAPMTDPTAIDTTDGMRSYLDGMERLVRGVLTHALDQPQGTRHRRRLVNLRERHFWRTRDAEVVDWFGARALAHMWIARGERGEFDSLVALAEADDGLWQAISGRPAEYPKRHAFHHVMEDLSGLVERYFATYPERRQMVERGVRDVMDFYAARLSSDYHEAAVLVMLVGIEGAIRSVTLAPGVRLRQVSWKELERLFLLEQDEFAAFSRDELRSWHYCFEIHLKLPRATRPTVSIAMARLQTH